MNKKSLKISLTSFLSSLVLGLSSCGGDSPSGHTHKFSSEWSYDDTYHWHACEVSGCTVRDSQAFHDYGEWIIDTPASEDHDGIRHKTCNTCTYSHSESYKYKELKPAERVYLANTSNELFNGYTYSLSPVVVPYDANKNVKYEVEHPELMSVTNDMALATGTGTTLIYAYNDENNDDIRDADEAFCVIAFTITDPEEGKAVTVQESVSLKVDETKTLQYGSTGIPSPYYGFYTEDSSICTISNGVVKGHRPGSTRISVSCKGYRAYCNVTIENLVDETGLRAYDIIAEDDFVLNKGDSKVIAYNILPTNSVDTLASITSNNEAVIKVNSDKSVTAIKGGTARIKLTTTNGKYTFVLITVKDDAQITDSYYNNYYGNLTWENSEDLINKLHNIISIGVTPLKYAGSPANWETNQKADQDLYDHSYVDLVYTDTNLLKTNTNTGWQREHAFCASLMTGYSSGTATNQLGRATDFHNLFAAGGGANGSRGNKCLGYARVGSQEIEAKENCIYDKKTFEPADEDKGRLARALMYMTVMYNSESNATITESSKPVVYNQQPLALASENVDYNKISLDQFMTPNATNEPIVNYYRSLVQSGDPSSDQFKLEAYEKYMEQSMPYAIGNASDIIEWGSFPVNYVEYQHNNSVYSDYSSAGKGTQGNRNPFVDYPELIEYAFGELKDEAGSLSMLTPTYLDLEMNKDEIHHYAVESETLKTFESGTKPTADDFNIKAIKNNLTEGTLDKSKITVEDYTFTDDDVMSGKVITIYTDKNTLKVPCKVSSESVLTFDTCAFHYKPDSGNRSDYTGSETSWVANFNSTKFDVTFGAWSTARGYFSNDNTSGMSGVKIGSDNNKLISLTFVSQLSYEDIDGAFFYASGSTNESSISYKVYVGDTVKFSGTISGSSPSVTGQTFQKQTGKIKVEFTNVNGIKFCGLAFNYSAA